jgi:hypothetical protein
LASTTTACTTAGVALPSELVEEAAMQDLVYMVVLVVFFVLAGLFVVACDRLIGPDDAALAEANRGAPAPSEPEDGVGTERQAA